MAAHQKSNQRRPAAPRPGASGPRRTPAHRLGRREPFIRRYRGAILAVAGLGLLAAVLTILALQATQDDSAGPTEALSADASVYEAMTHLPSDAFAAVGAGRASNPPAAIGAPPPTSGAKPEVLYVGGEFCPFCAAERWPLIVALSRFGTFSGLKTTRSAPDDAYPSTPTFTFYGSTYESPYLSFTPVEQFSNQRSGRGYAELQSLTPAQQQIVDTFGSGGGIPFLYFGGEYVLRGANFSPQVLAGKSWSDIASRLREPTSPEAQSIIGSANLLTATLCRLTEGQPGEVCLDPGTVAAGKLLK